MTVLHLGNKPCHAIKKPTLVIVGIMKADNTGAL